MCQKCDIEKERQRLLDLAIRNPTPCVVCESETIAGAATWLPSKRHHLAAGGSKEHSPMFSFCLCEQHITETAANDLLIRQAVLNAVRLGQKRKV